MQKSVVVLAVKVALAVVLTVIAYFVLASAPAAANQASTGPVVILVRHAEKATEPGNDPPLGAAGVTRAEALAAALRDARVTAIVTTHLRRTRETAEPLARARGITSQAIQAGPAAAHVEAVIAAIRKHGEGTVLVVGHSNTVPAIIAALGGPRLPDLCESAYSNLFTLVPGAEGMRLVKSRYGAVDAEGGAECK